MKLCLRRVYRMKGKIAIPVVMAVILAAAFLFWENNRSGEKQTEQQEIIKQQDENAMQAEEKNMEESASQRIPSVSADEQTLSEKEEQKEQAGADGDDSHLNAVGDETVAENREGNEPVNNEYEKSVQTETADREMKQDMTEKNMISADEKETAKAEMQKEPPQSETGDTDVDFEGMIEDINNKIEQDINSQLEEHVSSKLPAQDFEVQMEEPQIWE